MNWNAIPDIAATGFLILAFSSVLNRNGVPGPVRWLIGWMLILIHFFALLFITSPGGWAKFSTIVSTVALLWAGVFFMWETVPYKSLKASRNMLISILVANLLHTIAVKLTTPSILLLDLSAGLYAAGPMLVFLLTWRQVHPPLRIFLLCSYSALGFFLIYLDHFPHPSMLIAYAPEILLTYLICSVHFTISYKRFTAGSIIMICGMYLWAAVFLMAPYLQVQMPTLHIELEVWNLPKYIVASGMILLLLENQVEFNRKLAMHDALTGLPNRRLFEDRLTSAIERSKRSGTRTALLIVDLNDFKQVNDTYGHAIGDKLLQSISRIFTARLRSIDTVARTGGDEFAIVLEGPITRVEAAFVAESMLMDARNPLQLGEHRVQASFSVGLALYPEDAQSAEGLCIAADRQMYQFKEAKNSFQMEQTTKDEAQGLA